MSYGIRKFNSEFKIPFLSRTNPTPRMGTYSLRSILILSSHLRLNLPKDLFSIDLPVKIFKKILRYFILATLPALFNRLDLITQTTLG